MKKLLSLAVLLVLPFSMFAQSDEIIQQARLHRTDISPEVIAKVTEWKRDPIFHGNWIQNRDGKSLWLDGTEVLPEIDYSGIREYYPGVFQVSVKKEGSYDNYYGLYRADGTMLAPTKYKSIYLNDVYGFIEATEFSTLDGKMYNHATDVYSLEGNLIKSIKFQNPEKYHNSVNMNYNKEANLISARYYPKKGTKASTYLYFYPDGQMAFGPYETSKFLSNYYLKDGIIEEGNKQLSIPDFNPSAHPKIDHDMDASKDYISDDFKSNYWIRKASECFEKEKWEETLNFLNIYDALDYHIYVKNCPEALTYAIMWLRSNQALGNYKYIYDQVVGNKMFRYHLSYDKKKKSLFTRFFKDESEKEAMNICKEIFDEAASVVIAEQNEINRQRNAEIWAAALVSLSSTVKNILGSPSTSTRSAIRGKSNRGGLNIDNSSVGGVKAKDLPHVSDDSDSSGSNSRSSSSSSSSSSKSCRLCVGRGYCKTCTGTGVMTGYTLKDKLKCSTCNGTGKCPSCHGTGKQ